MAWKKIGDLLLEAGLITEDQLKAALAKQKEIGGRLGSVLVNMGFVTDEQITNLLSKQYGVPSVDLSTCEVDERALKIINPNVAQNLLIFPFKREGKALHLAMANPMDVYTIEDIKFATGFEIQPYVASEHMILKAIEQHYGVVGDLAKVMEEISKEEIEVVEPTEEEEGVITDTDAAPVVKLVNSILSEAVKRGASDIHIEPYKRELRVRFRIDGVLHNVMSPQYIFAPAIVARIKIMAKLDISQKRLPQDGHINLKVGGIEVDMRV